MSKNRLICPRCQEEKVQIEFYVKGKKNFEVYAICQDCYNKLSFFAQNLLSRRTHNA